MQSVNVKSRVDNGNVDDGVQNRYYIEAIPNVKFISVPMPIGLNNKDKGLHLHVDGVRVDYVSTSTAQDEPSIVRANHFIPPSCGLFYFEIFVRTPLNAPIAVGLCTKGTDKDGYLPGQQRHSNQSQLGVSVVYTYGYESHRGDRLGGSTEGDRYGPTWRVGDTIGCCLDYTSDSIHFTKNGTNLGVAFQGCGFADGFRGNLYPCIGLSQRGQSVEVNFGNKPFHYDLAGYANEGRMVARSEVLVQATAPPKDARKLMDHLILDFLRVYGYSDTADKFAHDIGQTNTGNEDQDTPARKDLFEFICTGKMQEAIEYLNDFYPSLLEQRLDILFEIKCQVFIEIIRESLNNDQMDEGDDERSPNIDAINFGRKELVPLSRQLATISENETGDAQKLDAKREKQRVLIRDVFSLLAYNNPYLSPVAHLLENQRREALARKVNRAVLKHTSRRKDACIESIVRQGQTIIELLVTHSQLPIASLLRVEDFM
jgi:hypothetical protein